VFTVRTLLPGITAVLVATLACMAQMPPGPWGGGFFPGDGLAGIQVRIRASDEEWKVIGPKIRAVMTARSALEAGFDVTAVGGNAGFDFGAMMPTNDSFEGPGTVNRGGFFGNWGFGGRGGFDPNMFAEFMRAFGRRGPGGRGGFDPNTSGPGTQGFGWGGFGGGMPGFGPSNPVTQTLTELNAVMSDPNVTGEQIREKITAVRTTRKKAETELAVAEKDLLQLLTRDQEAVLVILGYLD
jgi:hypothetical protein